MGEAGQSPALSRSCSNDGASRALKPEYPPLLTLTQTFAERGWRA
jgi:hypothetical protein